MKTEEEARALAETMTAIGKAADFPTAALLTSMEQPLGRAVGNSLEVTEAVSVLRGAGPDDLREISLALAAGMLRLADGAPLAACRARAERAVESGAAFDVLVRMTRAQGGDPAVLDDASKFPQARASRVIHAERSGFLTRLDAGRTAKDAPIDPAAGILLHKKCGDAVRCGDPLATLYAASEELLEAGEERLAAAISIRAENVPPMPYIYGYIDAEGWHD